MKRNSQPRIVVHGDYIDIHDNAFHGGTFNLTDTQKKSSEASTFDPTIEKKVEMPTMGTTSHDESVRQAIEETLAAVDEKGNKVFRLQNQWAGVHAILKLKGIYTGSDLGFGDYLVGIGIKSPKIDLPTKDFSRDTIKDPYDRWKPVSRKEMRIHAVAEIFKSNFEKLETK